MTKLENRVAKMEKATAHVDLDSMTDEELHAYAGKFPMFSKEMYAAVLTLVGRRPSAFPVVHDDPERGR
ncbi:hypothetical protein CLU85_1188 [Acidovorax sp. 69]|uniref:hypothetical protein n=1 Tax=Acidovorax sp. 69 TaxID=2035202 RepID=UPI000CBCCF62|nr:hypothetical protein [Acidovorax sp. 69]PJI96442.1 hypothetical protein CLU85_1188 [Acidovorax sp. 69]